MRRTGVLLVMVVALVAGLTPAGAIDGLGDLADDGVTVDLAGGLSSDNVEYIATIPIDSPNVSAKVRHLDDERLLYVSGTKGFTIYDISDPELPIPLGFAPLPHSQNEDVQVSEDGTRALIAADGGLPVPNPHTQGLHIVDTSDPSNPEIVAWLDSAGGGANHTAACADAACEWIYGNRGDIYHVPGDIEDENDIEILDRSWFDHDGERMVSGSHALNRSTHADPETGEPVEILISDSTPRLMMDVTDPAGPVLLTSSRTQDHMGDGSLQHNNLRPNAHFWTPRSQDPAAAPESLITPYDAPGTSSGQRAAELPADAPADGVSGGDLRPGELVIGNSESNVRPSCGGNAGGLTTFSIADFDEGAPMEKLHEFRPTNNNYIDDGNPAVNGLGCSGHWFDIQDGDNVIAASWYEHGIKLVEINDDYSMSQIGYFQPVATEAGAAYWVTGDDGSEYIYSTDYARGIDIVKFHRDVDPPSEEEMAEAWWANAGRVGAFAEAERRLCRLEY